MQKRCQRFPRHSHQAYVVVDDQDPLCCRRPARMDACAKAPAFQAFPMTGILPDLAAALRERLAIISDEESRRDRSPPYGSVCKPSRKKLKRLERRLAADRSIRSCAISCSGAATAKRWSWSRRSSKSSDLARIQLDDQLLVDHRLHFVARRDARDLAAERVAIRDSQSGTGAICVSSRLRNAS